MGICTHYVVHNCQAQQHQQNGKFATIKLWSVLPAKISFLFLIIYILLPEPQQMVQADAACQTHRPGYAAS